MTQMEPLMAQGNGNPCTEQMPRDRFALDAAPSPAIEAKEAPTQRTPSARAAAAVRPGPPPRAIQTSSQLHCGDDVFLRTRDARFAGQLSRLQVLARVPAPLLVSGEAGTGRRCLARLVARLVAQPQPRSVAAVDAQAQQSAAVELDARALPMFEVEQRLEDLRRTLSPALDPACASARDDGDVRPLRDPEHARCLLVLDVHLLSPRAQATLLALCDAGARAAGGVRSPGAGAAADPWRIVATTDDRIEEHARAGTFDSRLLAHLCAITVRMPRLRERSADIVPLAMLFLRRESERTGRAVPVLTPGAVNRLLAHSWHGNVPELHALMQTAFARCRKYSVTGDDIGQKGASCPSDPVVGSLRDAKRDLVLRFERSVLENLLQASHGNIAKAARLAQKNRRAFFELMRKHGIDARRFREADLVQPDSAPEIRAQPARV